MNASWLEDDDDPYDDDWSDDDESDTIECPVCQAEIFEDAVQCPSCGNYVVPDLSIWKGRTWWWIALGLLGIVAVILALSIGF